MAQIMLKRIYPSNSEHPTPKKYYITGGIDWMRPSVPEKEEIKPIEAPKAKSDSGNHPGLESWIMATIERPMAIKSTRCCVVIPIYKSFKNILNEEKISLRQTIDILGAKYDLVLVHPSTLGIDDYNEGLNYKFCSLGLNPDFFKRQRSYSNLCERYEFYECFNEYEYILICQTDAYIFKDELEKYLDMGYDYIGGIHLISLGGYGAENGNGGFSLRKAKKFAEVCKKTDWKKLSSSQLEDLAFTRGLKKEFNLAPVEVSFEFAWAERPAVCLKKVGHLPMGCHAFFKSQKIFYKDYIKMD